MEQLINILFNPPLMLISPNAGQSDNCLGMIVSNSVPEQLTHVRYKPSVGITKSGDRVHVLNFSYSISDLRSAHDIKTMDEDYNYTNENYVRDIVNNNYIFFLSIDDYNVENHFNYNEVAVYIMKRMDTNIWLYKQGNLPWCSAQKVGCDVINIFEIKVKFSDSVSLTFNVISKHEYNQLLIFGMIESQFDIINDYVLYIDVGRLLETSIVIPTIKYMKDRGGGYGCETFSICTVEITIDDMTSSVEPDVTAARLNLRSNRPVWFTSKGEVIREKRGELIYDKKLIPQLIPHLRRLIVSVFADMVAKYLIRRIPD